MNINDVMFPTNPDPQKWGTVGPIKELEKIVTILDNVKVAPRMCNVYRPILTNPLTIITVTA